MFHNSIINWHFLGNGYIWALPECLWAKYWTLNCPQCVHHRRDEHVCEWVKVTCSLKSYLRRQIETWVQGTVTVYSLLSYSVISGHSYIQNTSVFACLKSDLFDLVSLLSLCGGLEEKTALGGQAKMSQWAPPLITSLLRFHQDSPPYE